MATTQDGDDLGDTTSPSNDHYLSEGLDVIDIGSADSSLSPLVKLCLLVPISIDCLYILIPICIKNAKKCTCCVFAT